MDDTLFYGSLACLLIGVLLAAARGIPGCAGTCSQGRKECNCNTMRTHEYADVDGWRYEWVDGALQAQGLTAAQVKTAIDHRPYRVAAHHRAKKK